jgi:hypothetical protein
MKKTVPMWNFQRRRNELVRDLKAEAAANSRNQDNKPRGGAASRPLMRQSMKLMSQDSSNYELPKRSSLPSDAR